MGSRAANDVADVVLFDRNDFAGHSFSTRTNVENLSSIDFNDRAVSIIISTGRWEFCGDAGFQGRCVTLGPGRHDNLQDMSKKISSLRRVN